MKWKLFLGIFPAVGTVYYHFRKWSETTDVILFLGRLVSGRRKRISRKRMPTVAVLDSHSVQSGYSQSQKGVDGFKRVKGIKRQVLTDTNGYPLRDDKVTIASSTRRCLFLRFSVTVPQHCSLKAKK